MSTRFTFHGMKVEGILLTRGDFVCVWRVDQPRSTMIYLDHSIHGDEWYTYEVLRFLSQKGVEEIRKNMIFACEVIS